MKPVGGECGQQGAQAPLVHAPHKDKEPRGKWQCALDRGKEGSRGGTLSTSGEKEAARHVASSILKRVRISEVLIPHERWMQATRWWRSTRTQRRGGE